MLRKNTLFSQFIIRNTDNKMIYYQNRRLSFDLSDANIGMFVRISKFSPINLLFLPKLDSQGEQSAKEEQQRPHSCKLFFK